MMILTNDTGIGIGSQTIPWSEIQAIGIRTTSDGPFAEDVFWQIMGATGTYELPSTFVDGEFLGELQKRLPGIDSLKVIDAMGSTAERIFRVWHADDSKWQWNEERFRDRFVALVARLGGNTAKANPIFERLRDAWSMPTRRYHNLEHLTDCLRELDASETPQSIADRVELALWYHDVVYEPGGRNLEERSIQRLAEDNVALQIPSHCVAKAAECIRATDHQANSGPSGTAAELTSDIDLSILGKDVLRFMEYEYAVEEEHPGVGRTAFILARGHFLASLLATPSMFRTDRFRTRFESRARANLAAVLHSPRYWVHRWFGGLYRLVA